MPPPVARRTHYGQQFTGRDKELAAVVRIGFPVELASERTVWIALKCRANGHAAVESQLETSDFSQESPVFVVKGADSISCASAAVVCEASGRQVSTARMGSRPWSSVSDTAHLFGVYSAVADGSQTRVNVTLQLLLQSIQLLSLGKCFGAVQSFDQSLRILETPVGSPFASFTTSPPGGFGVLRFMPHCFNANEFKTTT